MTSKETVSKIPFPRCFLRTIRAGILRFQHAGLLKTCVLMRASRQKPRKRKTRQSPGFWASNKGSCVLRERLGSLARLLLPQNLFPLAQGGRWRQKSEPSLPQCLLPDQGPPDIQTGFPAISPHLAGYKQMKKWTKSCGLRKQSSNMGDTSDLSKTKRSST